MAIRLRRRNGASKASQFSKGVPRSLNMIISVSRRCDIPRFSFDWFLERLAAGFAEVRNPFNSCQTKLISLLPPSAFYSIPEKTASESAELFAFWTRDPSAILEHADDLERRGYAFFIMTTITGYPALLEPNMPPAAKIIEIIRKLSEKIKPERLIWRYDPVFLSNKTDFEFHRANFSSLAQRLGGLVHKVILSVYDEYAGAERRLLKLEREGLMKRIPHYLPGYPNEKTLLPELRQLINELAGIARMEGMEIQCCAEADLAGACIDGEYIESIFGIKNPGKDKGQRRPHCLCARSVDIGSYGSCHAECVYCYANRC